MGRWGWSCVCHLGCLFYITTLQLKPEAIERLIDEVFTHPIPGTEYSVWIWPGPASKHLYNMDLVWTSTGQAINSPFNFKLFAIASIADPILMSTTPREIYLVKKTLTAEQETRAGEEKFLEDGGSYVLICPGEWDVLFIVPMRSSTTPLNGDVLNFPTSI